MPALLGEATEALAEKTGPQIGGLLNASLGNAAELIITIVAISAGKIALVKASIIGSILGNLLFVLGLSLLLGGLKHGTQRFDRNRVSLDATMVDLGRHRHQHSVALQRIDRAKLRTRRGVEPGDGRRRAGALCALDHLHPAPARRQPYGARRGHRTLPCWPALEHAAAPCCVMVVAVVGLAVMSEFLVGSLEAVTETFGLSEFFVGIILVPIIGNVAEHLVAVQVALKNQMDLSLSIALGLQPADCALCGAAAGLYFACSWATR